MSEEQEIRRIRWRLVLGAEDSLGSLPSQWQDRDTAIGFLYDREYGSNRNVRRGGHQGDLLRRNPEDRKGSLDPSELTVLGRICKLKNDSRCRVRRK